MDTRRIERQRRRRSSLLPLTCGCLAGMAILGAVVVVAALFFLPQIAARVAGFTPEGDTDQVFNVTPLPTIYVQNPSQPAQVTVNMGEYGQQTFNNDSPQLYNFTLGSSVSGESLAVAAFTEAGLNELCRQRSTICSPNSNDPRLRNARIDLRPGGAVVYADVSIPQLGGIEQTAGVVLRWDAAARRAVFAGVDLNGTLYGSPPQGLGDTINEIEQRTNDLIQQLSVDAGGGVYSLSEVRVDDTSLTLILR